MRKSLYFSSLRQRRMGDQHRELWMPRITKGLLLNVPLRLNSDILYSAAGQTGPTTETVDADGWFRPWKPRLLNQQLKQATVNKLRIERYGALLEGAGTGRCLQGRNYAAAAWTKTNVTVDTTANIMPDGSTRYTNELRATANGGTVIQDLGVIGAGNDTFKVWLKRLTGAGPIYLTRDGGTTWTLVAVTDAWAEYTLTQNLANPDVGIQIGTSGDEVLADFADDRDALAFADSVVPAGAAAVARSADNLQYDNTSEVHCKAAAGTMFCAATPNYSAVEVGDSPFVFQARNTNTNRLLLIAEANERWVWQGTSGGVSQFYISNAAYTIQSGRTDIVAGAWAPNNFRLYVNGNLAGAATAGDVPAAAAGVINVGKDHAAKAFNGAIAHVLIYDRALSAREMAETSYDIQRMLNV